MTGIVLESVGGIYRLLLEDGREVEASLRGRLKKERGSLSRIVPGDRVRVEEEPGRGPTIEEVHPRNSELVRRSPGRRRPKILAANVDRAVVVVAAQEPDPHRELIDRLLVLAEANGLKSVLVVNKIDLPGSVDRVDQLARLYDGVGYQLIRSSAVTGEGLDELQLVLREGTSTVIGPSGAGKSSLLNRIQPGLALRTGALSRKRGTGRHTTVSTRLIQLECGGWVADTPGFVDAGLWGVDADGLAHCFPEFIPHLDRCRFRGCSHTHEPECAVSAAVKAGLVAPSRYGSYETILSEVGSDVTGGGA
jgi:ribosome biogenesis GTPase